MWQEVTARYVLNVNTWSSAVCFTATLPYAWRDNADSRRIDDGGDGWEGVPTENRTLSLSGIVCNYTFVRPADSMLTSNNEPVTELTLFHHYLE